MSGRWAILLKVCSILLGCYLVTANKGSDILDAAEVNVEKIANLAIQNFSQRCSTLATCDSPANCSHDACLLQFNEGDLRCLDVNSNKHCHLQGTTNGTCHRMNLDFSRSHVRIGQNTDLSSIYTKLSICSQTSLDLLFKNLSKPTALTREYFAPMDGSWRVFPGSPQDTHDCRLFDPRVRPWFRTSTSVPKVVVVLIDIDATMLNGLPPDIGTGTIFQAAKKMTKQLLTTLSETDYVNIIVFNSSTAVPLSSQAMLVQPRNGSDEDPKLEDLKAKLDNLTIDGPSKQSNLSNAILTALPMFEAANAQAARVIVMLTNGQFVSLGNVSLPTAELRSKKVKTFLYKFKLNNDNDVFLTSTTLLQQLCDVGGHFEPILENVNNGLLVFSKYFSYLANLKRNLTEGKPQYSNVYRDFEEIGGDIITISKPAFFQGDLIGVAGITIHLLGPDSAALKSAFAGRVTGYPVNKDVNEYVNLTCNIATEMLEPCGPDANPHPENGGLCPKTDAPMQTISEVMCCGSCKAPPPLPAKLILASTLGSFGGLIVVIIGICCIKRWLHKRELKREEEREFVNKIKPNDEDF